MAIKDKKIIEKVNAAIQQLRPFLEADGGDMELVEITDDFIVKVKLVGACSSCTMSPMTLRAGLLENLKIILPEIKGVESVVDELYV
ncbi:MAG: NifU family protein [Bacteroidia bacterium]